MARDWLALKRISEVGAQLTPTNQVSASKVFFTPLPSVV